MSLTVRPLDRETWPALSGLCGPGGAPNGCWCMYWVLGAGYHKRPRDRNRAALRRAAGGDRSPGLLAFDGDTAVGWARLSPRDELPWLDGKPEFARVDEAPVWSLPCFFVPARQRGRGVMTALVEAAVEQAAAVGAPALEAYPVDPAVPGATRNRFTGVLTAFERAGFVEVARRRPARPVVRRSL